jgi:hypothetical protein
LVFVGLPNSAEIKSLPRYYVVFAGLFFFLTCPKTIIKITYNKRFYFGEDLTSYRRRLVSGFRTLDLWKIVMAPYIRNMAGVVIKRRCERCGSVATLA